MLSLNRVMLIGNLTRDPELRFTPSGTQVAGFGVATNRRWTSQDGTEQNATDFHDIVVWGKLAEIAGQVLHKGQPAYVEGRLQTRSWEAPDGSKKYKTEIVADNLIALSRKGDYAPSAPEETGKFLGDAALKAVEKAPQEDVAGAAADGGSTKKTAKAAAKEGDKEPDEEVTIEDLDDIPF